MTRILLSILFLFSLSSVAQNRYIVEYSDKEKSDFDPYTYLDTAAIKSKRLQGLPLFDWYDLPVNPEYVSEVKKMVDSVRFNLRWFNASAIYATEKQIERVRGLDFVKSVKNLSGTGEPAYVVTPPDTIPKEIIENLPVFDWQLKTLDAKAFSKRGLSGKGVRICVVDVGFPGVKEHLALKHIFEGKRLIDGYDFIRDKPLKYRGFSHGTQVLNFIAGKIDTTNVGMAPDVEVLLARTEWMLTERRYEEEVWIKAIEWAHQKGARLVNSSLGYHSGSHSHDELDGKTAMLSKAANLAARKGLLVINSAGNEGSESWKRIAIPADADSVLTVGAIGAYKGVRTDFSSYGPTKDLRIKPNVSALGVVHWLKDGEFKVLHGTSFSAPLVTGFVACMLQDNPSLKPMDIIESIQKSSTLFPYYDYSHGYGVPQGWKYFGEEKFDSLPSIEFVKSPGYMQEEYWEIRHVKHEGVDDGQIFFHIQDVDGYVKDYRVVDYTSPKLAPKIFIKNLKKGDVIRAKHKGTFIEKIIE